VEKTTARRQVNFGGKNKDLVKKSLFAGEAKTTWVKPRTPKEKRQSRGGELAKSNLLGGEVRPGKGDGKKVVMGDPG